MEIWGSKCTTYHHHLEVIFTSTPFFFFYHLPSDRGQKPKLFPWFNDPRPWRVCSAEPGARNVFKTLCLMGSPSWGLGPERSLSDTLWKHQHLRFLLRRFCCCCKLSLLLLTRLKFKLNIFRLGVSKTWLWSSFCLRNQTLIWKWLKLYFWYLINYEFKCASPTALHFPQCNMLNCFQREIQLVVISALLKNRFQIIDCHSHVTWWEKTIKSTWHIIYII